MSNKEVPIPWAQPKLFGDESELVLDALESTWISGGPYVEEMERVIPEHLGCKFGVTVSNGTTALQAALLALDIGPGDEVIVPAFTFVAAANMTLAVGATPVYADVDQETWLLSPADVQSKITPRTKAILPVHLYGNVAAMDELGMIAEDHGIALLEDNAEAAYSTCQGRFAGTIGTVGTLSFQATKTITTGEGGMVLTDDEQIHARLLELRNHGMRNRGRYWHECVAYNFRLTNLQAALGCAQLRNIETICERRRHIHARYRESLAEVEGIVMQQFDPGVDPVLWAMAVRLTDNSEPLDLVRERRDLVMRRMKEVGIETRPGFYSCDMLDYLDCPPLPHASRISASVISLPTFIDLKDEQIERVCHALKASLDSTRMERTSSDAA